MVASNRVPIVALGSVAAATVLSRWRGTLRLTAIVKGTYAFAPHGEMAVSPPAGVVTRDSHHANNPMRSVRACSDLSPYLERADVLFSGHAHAGGPDVARMQVRLAVSSDRGVLLDKRLDVFGDRRRDKDGKVGAPKPFEKIPLVYERAYGGIGNAENPLGVGIDKSSDALPNVVYPDEARAKDPASLAPVAAAWAGRKRLLKGLARKVIDQPIAELPDDFAWDYFQAAPRDQQLPALHGREWIVLEGLNRKSSMIHMRLPAVRAAAMIYGAGMPRRPFELVADTLFIDGDAEQCCVTYRASVPLAGDEVLEDLCVAAGLELQAQPIAWPAALAAEELRRLSSPASLRVAHDFGGTLAVDEADLRGTRAPALDVPPPEKVLPFVASGAADEAPPRHATAGSLPLPGAPWANVPARSIVHASPLERTLALDDDVEIEIEITPLAAPMSHEAPLQQAAPIPAPAAEEPQERASAPARKEDVWAPAREVKPEPPVPKAPARAPVAVPPAAHKKSLYRKFDKS
jgi:hypothetical protein